MNDSDNPYRHSKTHTSEQLILVRNPPRERLGAAAQDFEARSSLLARKDQELHLQSEDALPLYEENIQKRLLAPVIGTFSLSGISKPKQRQKLVLDTQLNTPSHTTTTTTPTSTSTTTTTTTTQPNRSSTSSLSVPGPIQVGLPRFRHSRSYSNDSIESSPTTPTQAMIRTNSTPSLPSSSSTTTSLTPSSPNTSSPNIPPTATTNNLAPGTVKPRVRALTITSPTIASSPPREQVRKTTAIPVPRQRQNSASTTTHNSITSPGSSPPPDFLLDDDPFANLTGGSVVGYGCGRQPSVVLSIKGDVKAPRSPLVNDEFGFMSGPVASTSSTPPPLSPTTTGRSILGSGSISRITRAAAANTTTSRSTPTSPSRNTFSGVEGFGMRSSFPSISFSSSSRNSSGGSDSLGDSQRQPQSPPPPPRSPPQSPPANQRAFTQPVSRPPSFPHHSSSSSSSSSSTSQHHNIPIPHPHRPSPAHQRPAFKSRPSLPSLNTLARMNFLPGAGFVKKVRKGKVGAGLPFEPWNNLDRGADQDLSSGETSPVLSAGEVAGAAAGNGGGSGDENVGGAGTVVVVPPVPPLPTVSVSVSRSGSVSTELGSVSSWHGLNQDSRPPPVPTLRHSSSTTNLSSSSSASSTNGQLPPSLSSTVTAGSLPSQPIPMGQKPLLPSQILALGPAVELVYASGDQSNSGHDHDGGGIMAGLSSPPRSPTKTYSSHAPLVSPLLVPPPQLISRSSGLVEKSHMMPLAMEEVMSTAGKVETSLPGRMDVGGDVSRGLGSKLSSLSVRDGPAGYGDLNPVLAPTRDGGGAVEVGAGGGSDVDDDVDVDADRFMDQFMDHYDREEDERGRLGLLEKGMVEKKLGMDEDEMPPPPPPPLRSPTKTSASEIMAHDISVSGSRTTASADLTSTSDFANPITLDTSSAILAPTLRTRTRTKRTINTTPTINIDVDSEVDNDNDNDNDNSSLFESYLYTYPYPSPGTETGVQSASSSTFSLTPPVSGTWSPSGSVSPGSRSRSLSSTYTTLSFDSEGSFEDNNNVQQQLLLQHGLEPVVVKSSAEEAVLHAEVSVLGSPALSMPSGVSDSFVSIPGPGSVHLGPLSSTTSYEELSVGDNDSTTSPTAYDRDDRAGEAAEGFDSRRTSRHRVVSKLWVGESVSEGQSKGVVDDEQEEIVGEKQELEAEVKTEGEDVEGEGGQEFEWEYVTGGGGSFMDGSNGRNVAFGHEREGKKQTEEATVDTATLAAFSDDINLMPRHSLHTSTTTSLATPAMTQFISAPDALLKDDLAGGSSTALAAAFAMFSWKQGTSELVEGVDESSTARERNGNGNASTGGSPYHATHTGPSNLNSSPLDWNGRNGRRGGDDNDDDEEKRRRQRATLERGRRMDESSFLAISSDSSSSSGDDDDHYGPISPSASKLAMDVNLRTQTSRTNLIRATPSPSLGRLSASNGFPVTSERRRSRTGASRFSEDEDEDDDEDDYDDYGDDQQQSNKPHRIEDDDDDDIPLAKRIPSALTAQKSIRHQVRREREQKKQDKALQNQAEAVRTRSITLRPAGPVSSGLHDAAMPAGAVASSLQATTHHEQQRRQRTQTLTGKGSMSGNPFSPEDLARKLKDINGPNGSAEPALNSSPIGTTALYQQQQQTHLHSRHRSKSISRSSCDFQPALATEALPPVPIPHMPSPASHAQRTKSMKESSSSYRYNTTSPLPSPINPAHGPSSSMTLRPMRSFHRSSIDRRLGMDNLRSVPLPVDAEPRVSRSSTSVTRSRPPTRDGPQPSSALSPTSTPHHRSLSQSRSSVDRPSPMTNPEPIPPIPPPKTSHDEQRKLLRQPSSRVATSRTSVDTEKPPRTSSHQHRPVPALPSTASAVDPLSVQMPTIKPEAVVQQRVFVGDMQRFKMVEIGTSTTAGDVVEMIEADGSLMGLAGSGGWMVFEVAQDFGMERPIRSFELVTDVQASWNKDKMVNYLVLRMTSLAVPLNRSTIPSRSPTHSGYVEWEAKRGKWSKRWMQLREHSIWLSKRDNGRDEVQLCSLSNFDAYQVTRSHRAPKPFAFAVKSTDNLTFFENTADYLHSFACSEKDGKVWMEKILVARSYVIFQERHVLFNPKPVNGTPSGLSRAGTRKATNQRPAVQPLLAVPSPFIGTSQSTPPDIFEPGSLLSKQL